jgi:hypothetical protein
MIWASTVLMFVSLSLHTQVHIREINGDKPARGQWDFKWVKLWEITDVGGEPFADIGSLTSDDEENVYFRDYKRFKVFILDKNGKLITSFGKKGEGPGELKRMGRFFLVNNKLVFPDSSSNRVHYFSERGKHLKSVITLSQLSPRVMIDEDRLISIPWINWRDPKGKAVGFIYNIKDKSKKEIFQFSTFRKGMVRKTSGGSSYSFSFSHSALTPIMVVSYSAGNIFYGMSDNYEIAVKDLDMKTKLVFSVEREKTKVPPGYKDEVLKDIDWPDNVKKQIKDGFPDYFTFFQGIFSDRNRNIYVFLTDPAEKNRRKLDIFSPAGKYIYSAKIEVEEGFDIGGSHLRGDILYLGLEDEEGEVLLRKYKVQLPGPANAK